MNRELGLCKSEDCTLVVIDHRPQQMQRSPRRRPWISSTPARSAGAYAVGDDLTFRAGIVEDEGETRVVLSGDIDLVAVPEMFARMQEADRESNSPLIVVMDDVTLIDASGLGVLARLAAAGVQMELRGAQGIVRRALEITGIDSLPNVHVC